MAKCYVRYNAKRSPLIKQYLLVEPVMCVESYTTYVGHRSVLGTSTIAIDHPDKLGSLLQLSKLVQEKQNDHLIDDDRVVYDASIRLSDECVTRYPSSETGGVRRNLEFYFQNVSVQCWIPGMYGCTNIADLSDEYLLNAVKEPKWERTDVRPCPPNLSASSAKSGLLCFVLCLLTLYAL
ncbi:hypothetical protein ElyMa_005789000 [Elysia marginata]|uniref:Uncharacterized protein n=1 Tax=Elysia marginata TaxID=1093978 RepID=A0AAV4FR66_9GAST|nr:hypothetical protein ElyMa_005789000 [Elysia marginata]